MNTAQVCAAKVICCKNFLTYNGPEESHELTYTPDNQVIPLVYMFFQLVSVPFQMVFGNSFKIIIFQATLQESTCAKESLCVRLFVWTGWFSGVRNLAA